MFAAAILQCVDMIISLYENNFPMRFGLILYSSEFIKKVEVGGGDVHLSAVENESQKEDISSLVCLHFPFARLYDVLFTALILELSAPQATFLRSLIAHFWLLMSFILDNLFCRPYIFSFISRKTMELKQLSSF